jgi:hypothetical protein
MLQWIEQNFWIWTIGMLVVLGGLVAVLLVIRRNQSE